MCPTAKTTKPMKKTNEPDITRAVLSDDKVRLELGNIFPDSIILNKQFQIEAACKKICKQLGYSDSELIGLPISLLTSEGDLEPVLREKLHTGFFEECALVLKTRKCQPVTYTISGFYLGLISDIDDLIVLNLKNAEEVKMMHNQLEAKTHEMDDFVYHAAHSLRGPLATLKGLVHLAQICEDKAELDWLTCRMSVFVQRLDDKLSKLINYAESDKGAEFAPVPISLATLGDKLRAFVEAENSVPSIRLFLQLRDSETMIERGDLVYGILFNIFSYCLQQNRTENSELFLGGSSNSAFLEFELRTKGIQISTAHKEKLESVNFGYVEVLNETEFASLYAAKKIIQKLKGRICLTFPNPNEGCVYMLIPKVFYSDNAIDTRLKIYNIFKNSV